MWYLESQEVVEDADEVRRTILFKDFRNYYVGRKKDGDVVLYSLFVSRNHAVITVESESKIYITDISGLNGVYVNDMKIRDNEKIALKFNDLIGIGVSTCHTQDKKEIFRLRSSREELVSAWEADYKSRTGNVVHVYEIEDSDIEDDAQSPSEISLSQALKNIGIRDKCQADNGISDSDSDVEDLQVVPNKSIECKNQSTSNNNIVKSEICGDKDSNNHEVQMKDINVCQMSYSQDDMIIIDDDDDCFPASQLFNDDNYMQNQASTSAQTSKQEEEEEYETIFANIKKEVSFFSDNEECDVHSDDSDVDENCKKWIGKLSQSQNCDLEQLVPFKEQSRNVQNNLDIKTHKETSYEAEQEDFIETSSKEGIINSIKSTECKVSITRDLDLEKSMQCSNDRPMTAHCSTDATTSKTYKKIIPSNDEDSLDSDLDIFWDNLITRKKKTKPISDDSSVCEDSGMFNEMELIESTGIQNETAVPAPPSPKRFHSTGTKLLECALPMLPNGRRKKVDKPKETPELKRKRNTETEKPEKPPKRGRRKSRTVSSNATEITKDDKKRIKEERTIKLKKIAEQKLPSKVGNVSHKVPTKPKVKVSSSRGTFLIDEQPVTKKKFVIPKNQPAEKNKAVPSPSNCCTLKDSTNHVETAIPVQLNIENTIIPALNKPKSVKEKKVRFIDNPTVRMYDIPEGNKMKPLKSLKDAPMRITLGERSCKLIVGECEESVLMKILEWVPMWLEEQKLQYAPPSINKNNLIPMLNTFNSAKDYHDIVMPLSLLELWRSIFKDWISARQPVYSAAITRTSEPSNIKLLLHGYTLIKSNQLEGHPNRGDLVILEMFTDKRGEIMSKFGYVQSLYKRQFFDQNTYRGELLRAVNYRPDHVMCFTILIKMPNRTININKLIRIRLLSKHMNSYLRVFKAIDILKDSPLCSNILNPTVEGYMVPEQKNGDLVSKDNLDPYQLKSLWEAHHICSRKEAGIYMIQGPPGTGKSLVISNIIQQLINGDKKCLSQKPVILLCAPSNGAVDEITLKLLAIRQSLPKEKRFKMLRMGRSAAFHPKVNDISLQKLYERDVRIRTDKMIRENPAVYKDYQFKEKKINYLRTELARLRYINGDTYAIERALQATEKEFEKFKSNLTINSAEKNDIKIKLIMGADIIATTLSSCGIPEIEELCSQKYLNFSCCIVDEATQSYEQETLIPLTLGITRMVLVGDPAQLSPTVLSQEAKLYGYGQSLFSRLLKCLEFLPGNPVQMLRMQYRMHEEISLIPNEFFYGNKLHMSQLVQGRQSNILKPFKVFALNHSIFPSYQEYINIEEATFVLNFIIVLLNSTNYSIGVITPYSKQKAYLTEKFCKDIMKDMKNDRVDINTVDGFQGQERDVIILSCVRYNANNFISDHQRLNVALTRAKHALYVCAHVDLFKNNGYLQNNTLWSKLKQSAILRNSLCDVPQESITDTGFIYDMIKY